MSAIEELMVCDDFIDFNGMMSEVPGMVKAKAAWELHCRCGRRECFMQTFHYLAHGAYIEVSDVEELVRRWEGMIFITFEVLDQTIKKWIADYQDIRGYRCATEVLNAYDNGPGEVFETDEGPLFIGPGSPPPREMLEAMRAAVVKH